MQDSGEMLQCSELFDTQIDSNQRKLKNELVEIRRKGSRRPQEVGERQCARCLKGLGLIFDRGEHCEQCLQRVCSDCRVMAPKAKHWKCSICAKVLELKVVTGEWFLEERSKRFDKGTVLSSDVVKQSIMSSPVGSPHRKSPAPADTPERPDTPKSGRSAVRNLVDGAKRKGKGSFRRGSYRFGRVSRWSGWDRSRSELDLSVPGSASDEALSLRSRSVPGLNDTEFDDNDKDEDIDALMSAHSRAASRRMSCAVSTSSTPGSERKWGYLSVPGDSDAETTSLNSMMSMYSETGDYGNANVSGELLLNISYSYKTGALNVLVKECRNLATGDEKRQRTDAYVKAVPPPTHKFRRARGKTHASRPKHNQPCIHTMNL
nr:synaptotagmin-like protein 5 [Salvelinus alpinus]